MRRRLGALLIGIVAFGAGTSAAVAEPYPVFIPPTGSGPGPAVLPAEVQQPPAPPQVQGEQLVATPAPAPAAPVVAGVTLVQEAPVGVLPFTGADIAPLVAFALAAVAMGVLVLRTTRRAPSAAI